MIHDERRCRRLIFLLSLVGLVLVSIMAFLTYSLQGLSGASVYITHSLLTALDLPLSLRQILPKKAPLMLIAILPHGRAVPLATPTSRQLSTLPR